MNQLSHRGMIALGVFAISVPLMSGCLTGIQVGSRLLGAAANDTAEEPSELDGTGWLVTRGGAAFLDGVTLEGEPQLPSDALVPVFSVGGAYRVATLDFGGLIEHIPGGRTTTLNADAEADGLPMRLGDQVVVAGSVRWRFVDRQWGGFYVRFSPGLGVFGTTETFRQAVADRETGLSASDIASAGVGFSYSADLGFFALLSDWLILQVEVAGVGTHGTLTVQDEPRDYERFRGLVRAGFEWRL